MDRKQRISQILNKINEKFHMAFYCLIDDDPRLDWDRAGNPYDLNCHNKNIIVGRDTDSGAQSSESP